MRTIKKRVLIALLAVITAGSLCITGPITSLAAGTLSVVGPADQTVNGVTASTSFSGSVNGDGPFQEGETITATVSLLGRPYPDPGVFTVHLTSSTLDLDGAGGSTDLITGSNPTWNPGDMTFSFTFTMPGRDVTAADFNLSYTFTFVTLQGGWPVSAAPNSFDYQGGTSVIKFGGSHVSPGNTLTAFIGDTKTDISATSIIPGDDLTGTVELTFPPNTSSTSDVRYNIRISFDGGLTYDSYSTPPLVTVGIAPASAPDYVCQIDETGVQYESLEDAFAAVEDGQTVSLLTDITYTDKMLSISNGRDFSLDPAGYELSVNNSTPNGNGLSINNGTTVTFVDGALSVYGDMCGVLLDSDSQLKLGNGGTINATGGMRGVAAQGNSQATVTTATTTGKGSQESNPSTGVLAFGTGSEIVITGDVTASGPYCIGATSLGGGKVTAQGNVNASGDNSVGTRADYMLTGTPSAVSQVIVNGDVNVTGTGSIGAQGSLNGTTRIDGALNTPTGETYIKVGDTVKTPADSEAVTTLDGYKTYTDKVSVVWVKNNDPVPPPPPPPPPVEYVCQINETGVQYESLEDAFAVVEDGQTVSLLKDITYTDKVLSISNGRDFSLDPAGFELSISNSTSGGDGLSIQNGTTVTFVDGALPVYGDNCGVVVNENSQLKLGDGGTVNATGGKRGVAVSGNSQATVTTATTTGKGSQESDPCIGALALGSGSEIVITGDVTASGPYCIGAAAGGGGKVTAQGDVNASGESSVGTRSDYMLTGTPTAVSQVIVNGDVNVIGAGSTGAQGSLNGTTRIDGTLHVSAAYNPIGETYIKVGDTVKTAADSEPVTTLDGYKTYTDENSTVWVKDNDPVPPPPTPDYVCQIDETGVQYESLEDAFAVVEDGQTVSLLKDITYTDKMLSVSNGRDFSLDPAGFELSVNNSTPDGDGLSIQNGSTVTLVDGSLTVVGYREGVVVNEGSHLKLGDWGTIYATGGLDGVAVMNNSSATVTSATSTGEHQGDQISSAAAAYGNGCEIVVNGDANASGDPCDAVFATAGGKVTVQGNVTATGGKCIALVAGQDDGDGSTIIVNGDVTTTGTEGGGAWARIGSTIRIDGTLNVPDEQIYIQVGTTVKTAADFEAVTTLDGYQTYTDAVNTVWVKNPGSDPTPTPDPNPEPTNNVVNNNNTTTPPAATSLPQTGDVVGILGGSIIVLSLALGVLILFLRRRIHKA